ncbi:MAG: NAD-binding protein [Chloroflexi bacterium]|nr:NAD-binding protein [Chloroflexota bacterium]
MPSSKPTLRERVSYQFDNLMSKGTFALIAGLFLTSLTIILLAAAIIRLGGLITAPEGSAQPMSFGEAAWESLMRTLDSGTMGGDTGVGFRVIMLFVTLGGVFVVSTLIGVLSNGIEDQMDRLRKGRSRVLESDHTVILGWSPQVFTTISELVEANKNRRGGAVIAILADEDKVEMEDEIRERIPDTKNTKVICRSGSPIDPADIEIVSPHTARSIIVLPESKDPDAHVIKCVLALTNNPNRREEPYHIVTQVRNPKNLEVLKMVGQRDHVQPILSSDLIARIVAQTSRQSGLSVVYTELMNFGGDEIYFVDAPASLIGKTYGDSLLAYENSTVIGLERSDGTILMNPPMETDIRAGDRIFAISEDDDTVVLSGMSSFPIDEKAIHSASKARKPGPEKCLILGWNRSGTTIICELDNYVVKGSQVTVVSDVFNIEKQIREHCGKLPNQKVTIIEDDTTDRTLLEKINAPDYDHVIVLAYSTLEPQEADARTLVTLLHLRDIAVRDETPFSIVSEMLDLRNRELAEVAGVDDFIVSEHLVSLMMTQLSENADLFAVFTDIFDPEGSEIYLKPVSDYVATGQAVNFYTVTEAAKRRGETAIGYRLMSQSDDADKSYGVHTNPKKSEMVTFAPEDKIIVIAEN